MPTPILTLEQRQEVRTLYATGGYTQQALAERYGVTQTNISTIVRSPQRVCVDCGTPLIARKYCQRCAKAHNTAYSLQWARKHKDKVNERQRTRWQSDERIRLRHRVSARESQRRRYAERRAECAECAEPRAKKPARVHTKHIFTMCEHQDGTATMQCMKCGLAYHVVIQAIAQPVGNEDKLA